MKLHPIIWFSLFILIVFGVWSYAWWSKYGNLPEKMDVLSKKIELLSANPDSLISTKNLSLEKLEFKIEKTEIELRRDFNFIFQIGFPLTFLGLFGLFYSVYKASYGIALKQAQDEIGKAYKPEEDLFKTEKRLLVLTKTGSDSNFIRKWLNDVGFLWASTVKSEVELITEDNFSTILENNKFDLIFFNNEQSNNGTVNSFSNEEIELILNKTPSNTMVFNFGKPNLSHGLTANQRVASAGFKSQIYGNLINALKYQKYLK